MKKAFKHKHYDALIIGGGASGLMAATIAAQHGKKVLIIEKNTELGKKLKITGGGRCNITNATFNVRELLKKYGDAEKFLYSPFSQFGVEDTFNFFEKNGLPLVVQARRRAFPHTERAHDVFRVFERLCNHPKVDILLDTAATGIRAKQESRKILGVATKKGFFTADNYIISTGGSSHPETGSTGDAFRWLSSLGHTCHSPTPNIVPLKTAEAWGHDLAGTSLSFMKITFFVNNKKAFSKTGKILFTHFGLSGPLILNSAAQVSDLLHAGEVKAYIDCYPDTDIKNYEEKILKVFEQNKNKDFKNIIKEVVPEGMHNAFLQMKIIPGDTKVHSISREQRKDFVQTVKALPLTILDLMGMDRAVISDGGVPLTEIDTRTMKSRLYDNLYLIGDILHINRPSGGYSLQLCWTMGYVAGLLQ